MCFPSLRRDNQLIAFNRQLEKLDYDILAWRDAIASKGKGRVCFFKGLGFKH